jgi:hypothetical protein
VSELRACSGRRFGLALDVVALAPLCRAVAVVVAHAARQSTAAVAVPPRCGLSRIALTDSWGGGQAWAVPSCQLSALLPIRWNRVHRMSVRLHQSGRVAGLPVATDRA